MPRSDNQPKSTDTLKYFRWAINAALGAAFILDVVMPDVLPKLDDLVIVLAAVASIAALNCRLPLQNVLLAAFIAALIGGAAHGLSARPTFAIPFGPVVFSSAAGAKIFYLVPWIIPLLWIVAVFNARGLARLILRPWRKIKTYGFWLIGLTAVLVLAFDVALEPFASHQVKGLWLWQPTKIKFTWFGATPLNFLGWAVVSLLILAFATPALIKKQPSQRNTPDYHPLAVWLGALILFAVGSARAGLWWPVGVDTAIAAVTAVFAVRGGRW
ncbi:MAG TPA: carotenoid biosynthesis protein [Verrucomicrobiae bacterium]